MVGEGGPGISLNVAPTEAATFFLGMGGEKEHVEEQSRITMYGYLGCALHKGQAGAVSPQSGAFKNPHKGTIEG